MNESNTGYLALVMAAAEEEVLEQYKDIMPDDLPAGVPPARTHEHEIVEEPGAKPVSRAPYRLMGERLSGKEGFRKDLGTELRPATADPIGGISRRTIRGTFREQQDVSRNSEVLLLAPDGSRCAAVRHLLRHVPADEEQQAEKAGLLQPLPVPEQPWQVVSLDFITGLPSTSRGHDSILVVIDKFSKMGHFLPTNATATTEATARLFFDRIITIHGIPTTLISDRDPKFTSKFWKELMGLLGTKCQNIMF
ncbi:unnamed protein product [Closterium sp. NIES-54]